VPNRLRHLLDIVGSFVAMLLIGFATYHIGLIVVRDYSLGRTSNSIASTPLWVPEGLLLVGLATFIFRLLAHALVSIRGFIRNDGISQPGPSQTEVIHG
jgi:TRAP-type mannitol/chloroaromatic compound transport system permease small subunit